MITRDEEVWTAPTDICCPSCGSNDRLTYARVPEHRRLHGDTTEYFGEGRDYTCRNCDAEFFMQEATP